MFFVTGTKFQNRDCTTVKKKKIILLNPLIKVTGCLFVSVCWYRKISLSAAPIFFTLTMKPIKGKTFKYFRDKYHYPSQDEFALEKTPLPLNIIFSFSFTI